MSSKLTECPDASATGASEPDLSSVVVLVHGIRTYASWMNQIAPSLEAAGFAVERTNYGRLDLFRFLIPIPWLRKYAIRHVQTDVRTIRKKHPEPAQISFIAHSFGTFIVAEILKDGFDFKAHRIVFCGSIVHRRFPFEQIMERFEDPVVNDVGAKDVLPALAESVTWGYSSSGTHGFNRPNVQDRLHDDLVHSDFLRPEFCKRYWIPFLKNGTIVETCVSTIRRPWWHRLLFFLPIKYVMILLIVVALLCAQLASSPLNVALNPTNVQNQENPFVVDMRTQTHADWNGKATIIASIAIKDNPLVFLSRRTTVERMTTSIAIDDDSYDWTWRYYVDQSPGTGWFKVKDNGQVVPSNVGKSGFSEEIAFVSREIETWKALIERIKNSRSDFALFSFTAELSWIFRVKRTAHVECKIDLKKIRDKVDDEPDLGWSETRVCL